MKDLNKAFITLFLLVSGTALASGELEVRVVPGDDLIPNKAKAIGVGYQGLDHYYDFVLQAVYLINRGTEPLTVTGGEIEVFKGGQVIQTAAMIPEEFARTTAQVAGIQQMGFTTALDVMYAAFTVTDEGIGLAPDLTAAPGTAVLVDDYYLTVRSLPDSVRISGSAVTASGRQVTSSATLPVADRMATNDYIFPLEPGAWQIVASPSINSHHRWTPCTEFAMDITMVDERGSWAKGDFDDWTQGLVADWEDWYAYGKPVLAAADGVVVKACSNVEFPLDFWGRQPDEPFDAYQQRIGRRQMELFLEPNQDPAAVAGGNHIVIEHANGEYSFYAHLAYGSIRVAEGERVTQGQPIAGMGGTGEMPEVHLHFQVSDGPSMLRSRTLPVQFNNVRANTPYGYAYHPELMVQPGFFVVVE